MKLESRGNSGRRQETPFSEENLSSSRGFNPSAIEDAVLQASMLAGAVRNELGGVEVGCKCCFDTEFGCDDCIPKNLVAMPAERRDLVEGSIQLPNVSWIAECPRSDY